MVVPHDIAPQDLLDPLLLLPIPEKLPRDSLQSLETVLSALESHLEPSSSQDATTIDLTVLTAQMRQITRNAYVSLNAGRAKASEARRELDEKDTGLRGVEYERARIRGEIDFCGQYRPTYTALELQDADAFVEGASQDIRDALPATSDEGYDHAVILAQLEQELAEIIEREDAVTQLSKDRDNLIRAKKQVKLDFDKYDETLKAFEASTVRIAERLATSAVSEPRLSATASAIAVEAAAKAHEEVQEEPQEESRPATPEMPATPSIDAPTPPMLGEGDMEPAARAESGETAAAAVLDVAAATPEKADVDMA